MVTQFHMEGQMALTFMRHFVNSFEEEKENTAAVKKAKSILKALTVGAVKQVAGDVGAEVLENVFQKEESAEDV